MTESEAIGKLKHITRQLEELNQRLETENARFREAILLLTEAVDAILPYVVTDQAVIEHARAANEAARRTISA